MKYVIVGISLGLVGAAIAFCIRAYRLLYTRTGRTVEQHRAHEQDIHDVNTIWELGHRTASPARRGVLQRLALGLIGAMVARSAARGDTSPAATEFLTKGGNPNDPGKSLQDSQIAQNSHIDVPGPGGSYADFAPRHSDNPRPYSDNPRPHSDNPRPHSDNPRPHSDTPHGDRN